MTKKKHSSRKYIYILLVVFIISAVALIPKLLSQYENSTSNQKSIEKRTPIAAPENWASYTFENVTLFAPNDLFFGLADPNYFVNSSSTYLLSNINDFSARQDWSQNEKFTISFSFYPKELSDESIFSSDRYKRIYKKSAYLYDGYLVSRYKAVNTEKDSTPVIMFFQIDQDQVLKVNVNIIEHINDNDYKKYEEIANTILNSISLN